VTKSNRLTIRQMKRRQTLALRGLRRRKGLIKTRCHATKGTVALNPVSPDEPSQSEQK
jgi:hypothetical protein